MLSDNNSLIDSLKIALVHERLNILAGSEKVVFTMHDMYPDAHIFTSMADAKLISTYLPGVEVKTSFLQKLPLIAKHHQKFLPMYMLAFEQFDLSEYDLVISSCHCAAKAVITKPHACHICYCHSPMRYIWDMQHAYTNPKSKLFRALWMTFSNYVRIWDLATAFRVDYFIANSKYIARRIEKFYGKPASAVIYPPVEIDKFAISPSQDDYYLVATRFAPYKRVDLIIETFNRLGWRLVIVGDGEQKAYLKKIAGPNIEFKGSISDDELTKYMAGCKALIHAAEEDFGINMVEANASGRPVVAYGVGGAAEIVEPGFNGILFQEPTESSLINALKECEALAWDPTAIRQTSFRFSIDEFKRDMGSFVEWAMNDFRREDSGMSLSNTRYTARR